MIIDSYFWIVLDEPNIMYSKAFISHYKIIDYVIEIAQICEKRGDFLSMESSQYIGVYTEREKQRFLKASKFREKYIDNYAKQLRMGDAALFEIDGQKFIVNEYRELGNGGIEVNEDAMISIGNPAECVWGWYFLLV